MKKKIGYIIVIFLIISIIFRLLNLFGTEIKSDSTFGNIILLIAQIASVCSLPAILFYYDRNKNESGISIVGFISIAIYIFIIILYYINVKSLSTNLTISNYTSVYEKMARYTKFVRLSECLVLLFQNMTIINLISIEKHSEKAHTFKILAYIAALVYALTTIILIWRTTDIAKLSSISLIANDTCMLFMALFVILEFSDTYLEVQTNPYADIINNRLAHNNQTLNGKIGNQSGVINNEQPVENNVQTETVNIEQPVENNNQQVIEEPIKKEEAAVENQIEELQSATSVSNQSPVISNPAPMVEETIDYSIPQPPRQNQ